MPEKAPWVSIAVYAQHFDAHPKTVHKWLAAGLLDSYRVGRMIRVRDQPPGTPMALEAATAATEAPPPDPPPARRPPRVRPVAEVWIGAQLVPEVPGVYVVRYGGAGKIGCSKNLRKRLLALRMASPTAVIMVGVCPQPTSLDAFKLEYDLHARCRDERIRGEWYRLTVAVVGILRQHMTIWNEAALLDDRPRSTHHG